MIGQQERGELPRWRREYRGIMGGVVWGRHSDECGIVRWKLTFNTNQRTSKCFLCLVPLNPQQSNYAGTIFIPSFVGPLDRVCDWSLVT